MRIQVEVNDAEIRRMLQRLIDAGTNPRPALLEIGEELVESIKKRFESQSGPDGVPWERNAPSTVKRKGRDQSLTGRGKDSKGTLMDQINYQLSGNDTLEVGSPTVYAAMQQFGGTKAQFPHLWGDIPARPCSARPHSRARIETCQGLRPLPASSALPRCLISQRRFCIQLTLIGLLQISGLDQFFLAYKENSL